MKKWKVNLKLSKMKEQDLRAKLSAQLPYYSVADNERKTDQCVQIAKDYAEQEAIDFSDWKDKNAYPHPFEENKYQFSAGIMTKRLIH